MYKKLAIQFHPDKNPECGERCVLRFDEISKAYDKVGEPEKRKAFDSNKVGGGYVAAIGRSSCVLIDQKIEAIQ